MLHQAIEAVEPFHAVVYRMQSPQPAHSVTDHMRQRDAEIGQAGQGLAAGNADVRHYWSSGRLSG